MKRLLPIMALSLSAVLLLGCDFFQTKRSSDKAIEAVTLETIGIAGIVDEASKKISFEVPFGADVSSIPVSVRHSGISVSPASESSVDLFRSTSYVVTAADGSTATYTVSVITINVYIGGFAKESTGVRVPSYWVNDQRTELSRIDTTRDGNVYSIDNYSGNVYACGYSYDATGNFVPCYWVNGVRTDFSTVEPGMYGRFSVIKYVGGRLYIGGQIKLSGIKTPCYWVDGERVELSKLDSSLAGEVLDMAIVDGHVYASGYTSYSTVASPTAVEVACLWNDGVRTDLSSGLTNAKPYQLRVDGGVATMFGYSMDGDKSVACYWSANQQTDLDMGLGAYGAEIVWGHGDGTGRSFVGTRLSASDPLRAIVYSASGLELLPLDEGDSESWINYGLGFKKIIMACGVEGDAALCYTPVLWSNGAKLHLPVIDSSKGGNCSSLSLQR